MDRQAEFEAAVNAGIRAFLLGFDVSKCPHGPGDASPHTCVSVAHRGWLTGWWRALFESLSDEQKTQLAREIEGGDEDEYAMPTAARMH